MSILAPFQLLELNVISAQDLAPISRSMKTYAIAWVHPHRKLSTRVDTHGHNNPTWNDKFVFRVDDEFLETDTSAVMIEIYALHWFKDVLVGTVRILVGNLLPNASRCNCFKHEPQIGMRFVALQVRRPSGRPQGILNIGVALLHSSMRSMPLYSQLSMSAVGYRQLMGEEDVHHNAQSSSQNQGSNVPTPKAELRRVKSDTSSMIGSQLRGSEMLGYKGKGAKSTPSSTINGSDVSKRKKKKVKSSGTSSTSGSEVVKRKNKWKASKASSFMSGSENSEPPGKAKNVKLSWTPEVSEVGPAEAPPAEDIVENGRKPAIKPEFTRSFSMKIRNEKQISKVNPVEYATPMRSAYVGTTPLHGKSSTKVHELTYGTPRKSLLGRVFMTESELGPSPSEVAATMAQNQKADEGGESSVMGAWSLEESIEGLQSKLDRWRTELPPVYDRGEVSSLPSSESRHVRRHTDGDGGLFSCFSNICGCQCSIVCGGNAPKKSSSGRVHLSSSADDLNYKGMSVRSRP